MLPVMSESRPARSLNTSRPAYASRMARNARPMLWLLPIGLALGHLIGTCFGEHAGAPTFESGGRLFPALGMLGAPLAVLGLLQLFSAGQDRTAIRPSYTQVIVIQAAAFLAIEAAEHLLTGVPIGRMFGHPGLWWALVGQIVVAYLVVAAARLAVAAGTLRAEMARPDWPPVATPLRPGLCCDLVEQWRCGGSVRRRGPPLSLLR